ncbi:OmpL47-type beta-barrel domain-containing protein [Clostridium tagluense]|uniref:OmpL47-type beta-barrel domain-containing protein n=1 Tax=Clostridium tagluense TaxID=360422 RepID=UPI001C6E9D66|nr:PA14 domain-containing protein [Clostridium tagluense]MBW9155234.1 hypothetical protein [Clostridium tagluense]WLC64666.1 hypothetical protein KTC93_17660 [Clostridium tagluense]
MLFKKYKRQVSFLLVLVLLLLQLPMETFANEQSRDINNGEWSEKNVTLYNTKEADIMVRVGDIDDFGLGWEYTTENFFNAYRENNGRRELWTTINPFSGESTSAHYWGSKADGNDHFQWELSNKDEPNGVDRIIKTSGERGALEGYGSEAKIKATDTQGQITIEHNIKNKIQSSSPMFEVKAAKLQMFVDDFQAGEFSDINYEVKFNNVRIPELEEILNSLKQSGPVGKLITFEIPEKYLNLLTNNNALTMSIDDPNSSRSEGYAIDFVKLLINPKDMIHEGSIRGRVTERGTNGRIPIENAYVSVNGKWEGYTDVNGYYEIKNITSGLAYIKVYKSGQYEEQQKHADVVDGSVSEQNFELEKVNIDKFIKVNKSVGPNLGIVGQERYKVTLQIDNDETPNIKCDYIIQDEIADEFEVVQASLSIAGTNGPQKKQTMNQDVNKLTFGIHDQGPKKGVSVSYEIKRKDKYILTGMYPTSRKQATLNYKLYLNNGKSEVIFKEDKVEFPDVKVQLTGIDTEAPAPPSINVNEAWVNIQQVKATITPGTDKFSGIDRTEYKLSGATTQEWKNYNDEFIVQNEGLTKIEARTIDKMKNCSITSEKTIRIDRTPPTGDITGNPTVNVSEANLTIKASDIGGSGVKNIQRPDGIGVNGSTATFKVTENKTYTFVVEDNAGNKKSIPCIVSKIATNMPKINIKIHDATGLRDSYDEQDSNKSPSKTDKILNPPVILKGNSVAEIKVTDEKLINVKYKFVTTPNMPADGELIPINDSINQEIVYPDLLKDKVGYLTARNYDVSNLLVKEDESTWNDRSKVFANPSSEIEIRSANVAQDIPSYISNPQGRFKNHTIFMNRMDIGNSGPYKEYKESAKFWGYITPPKTDDYYFGTMSDDGSKGYIIIDNMQVQIVDQFKIQGSTFKTDNRKMHLEEGKFYPVYLEYSNWGGEAEFRLLYKNSAFSTNSNPTGGTNVPAGWFRPTSKTEPGEFATTTFESTAVKGIPFPEQTNTYYLAFKAENEVGGIREGVYGPFVVDKTLPTGTFTINPSTWTNSNVIINLNASDEHSGIKRIRKSGGEWTNADSANYTVSENGTYTFEVEDNAGNVATISYSINNIDRSIIHTGLFINNQFKKQENTISIVKGFSTNLAFEITNLKSKQVKLEMNDTEFIRISDVKVYASTDLKNAIKSITVTGTGNTFTIENLPITNNNYVFVFKATGLKITTGPISDIIKINDFLRNKNNEQHSINVVKLPPLQ